MDRFLKYNRKGVADRQIDTLIGLAKGFLADGAISVAEGEFLHTWLVQSRQVSDHPIIVNLHDRVAAMLNDGVLDAEELQELLATLRGIAGSETVAGEIAVPTTLPLNNPPPPIAFEGRSFLFTGTCMFGSRRECHEATVRLGGLAVERIRQDLHYLVIGSYVTDSWAHESFGRKIEQAMSLREAGKPIAIVSEDHWVTAGRLV